MARAIGYERLWSMERPLLMQNNDLVPEKSMGYEGLWIMRAMGYEGYGLGYEGYGLRGV